MHFHVAARSSGNKGWVWLLYSFSKWYVSPSSTPTIVAYIIYLWWRSMHDVVQRNTCSKQRCVPPNPWPWEQDGVVRRDWSWPFSCYHPCQRFHGVVFEQAWVHRWFQTRGGRHNQHVNPMSVPPSRVAIQVTLMPLLSLTACSASKNNKSPFFKALSYVCWMRVDKLWVMGG